MKSCWKTFLRNFPLLAMAVSYSAFCAETTDNVVPPTNFKALSRQLRVDLVWSPGETPLHYEVRRARQPGGPFEQLPAGLTNVYITAYSDFIGVAGGDYYYQVRSVRDSEAGRPPAVSPWSQTQSASPQPFDAAQLLTEVQEAGFRYFYDYAHPISGLARVGTRKKPDVCSIGGTGWGLCNLVAGVDRGFITRREGIRQVLKILRFLSVKADRFHGAFPHWINGGTGKTIPFSQYDDGADLVETAFLMEGVILCREYFSESDPGEIEIRDLANTLWRSVEWNWFVQEKDGRSYLIWHWSPDYGWYKNHPISGFNECQLVYILALASPTHAVEPKVYWQGWQATNYGSARTQFGVPLELGRDLGPPLFWTEYSYMAFDPHAISYHGKTYFEHFQNFCKVDVLYAESKKAGFKGYGPLWGWTAGLAPGKSTDGPDGYRAFAPGARDDGTINPSAGLSSMPYAPKESLALLQELYLKHGREYWGPFGFYDAFNQTRNWVARDYLGNEVGTIAPMIENYRSGLCWNTFMKAPEIRPVLKILAEKRDEK
jgi:hypothetical protein